ncbi:MAG TPA: hypothetical protein VLI40_00575 [Gemmatimonadaceae bacterium]|nr:hypothetical protein [Gemmatimonadaceae bacterium]
MRTVKALSLACCLAFPLQPAYAQATRISAPNGHLLQIAQTAAAASPLGSLVSRRMASDDVELRVWDGFGVTGTLGVILRRAGGRWYAWRATLVHCDLYVAMPIGDTASAATESLFVARARRECGASVGDTQGGSRVYSTDTLALERISVTDPETLWSRIVAAGGLRLPPRRPMLNMRDGNLEVVEIRRGESYRASVFEAVGDATGDADGVARFLFDAVVAGTRSSAKWKR